MSAEHDEKLAKISKQIKKHIIPESVTVREFISWFGAHRRTYWNVEQIRKGLKKYELVTHPDFQSVYVDSPITFHMETKGGVDNDLQDTAIDPTYRISRLESANKPPISVKPDDSLITATSLMLANNFSQLPVMTGERDVKGMITWESIGSRVTLGKNCKSVRDCMDKHYELSADTYLFDAISHIIEHEYILVRSNENIIIGIVTTADISLQFRQLGEPFLILGEIENYIRRMIRDKYTEQELIDACDPSEKTINIESVSDLTLGGYLRLLEKPEQWKKLDLSIDRKLFVEQLNDVRRIRNDVMHFDPDGIQESDLETLRKFVAWMQGLARLGVL